MARLLFVVFGSLFVVYGLVAIETGHVAFGRAIHTREIFVAKEPVGFWIVVSTVLLLGVVFVYRGIRGWKSGRSVRGRRKAERDEAVRLGIVVRDVERDLPQFARGNRSCQLVRGACVRYSLPRQGQGTRSVWSLLQRTERDGAQLPNGYLLQGEVSDALRQILTKLATEFSEEYFEFEGTTTDVAVYWEEWGGASEVEHVHQVLQSLAGL